MRGNEINLNGHTGRRNVSVWAAGRQIIIAGAWSA